MPDFSILTYNVKVLPKKKKRIAFTHVEIEYFKRERCYALKNCLSLRCRVKMRNETIINL